MSRIGNKIFNWELWPFGLRYLFISPVWAWYCLRSGSFWFFSASDPTLTFGGFEGEGKKEMYDLLPLHTYPKTIFIDPETSFESVEAVIGSQGFSFPFCVKPDVGMKGLLVRRIDNLEQLRTYHSLVPIVYIIQDWISYPHEVSVFYYRFPNQDRGVITGFIQKDLMEVKGDGHSTLLELIQKHPKAMYRVEEIRVRHQDHFDMVLRVDAPYPLAYAANLNRGATFTNLEGEIDEPLLSVFDELSHPTQFYYGRYDIKCCSIADLKLGRNYSILEFNGSGAEPNHVYNCGYSLLKAYKVFLLHWKVLYDISKYNHKNGIKRYWPFGEGWRFLRQAKRHLKILEKSDREILI